MMPRPLLILLALALVPSVTPAAALMKTHKWQDEICENTLRYDPQKIDEKALLGTIEVLGRESGAVPLLPFVDTPAAIAKIDPAAFATECAAQASRMRAHPLLPLDGLDAFRQERVRQIEDACAFGSAYARGYRDAAALRSYRPASPHCDAYIDALEGKTDLTALWRKRIAENCADNASPASCRQRYEAQGEKPDGEAWKRLYLTGFGWGNCATNHTGFNEGAKRRDALWEKLSKAFRRAYKVRQVCDEP